MRIVMLGAGALGGLFAHHLAMGGADLVCVDTDAAHVAAIRAHGLRLRMADGEQVSPVRAAQTGFAGIGVVDLLVLFVKGHASREALEAARPVVGPHTVIVTLQNGLGNAQVVRAMFPAQHVLYGLTTLTSDRMAPGVISPRSTAAGVTDVWTLDPSDLAPVDAFVALLKRGGIAARVTPDIDRSIWKKLVVNCAFNGLCAVTDLSCGQLGDQPAIWPVLDGICDEVLALAAAEGVAIDGAEARAFLRDVAAASRAHHPSMVQDVRARRRTEIDNLNGAVLRGCERHGLAAPFNRMAHALVSAVEANYGAAQD
ncbi:MAG: 2-dehydropantoate 2-reductase [Pseudomonadota bacterium]